ncbi:DUF1833 family protein [Zoogloea sp.]|uniref:DUF1833 family protein n=1 Tax=Zoogloea sp. TaxID=49181 RepID=UPI0035B38685
MSRTYSLTARRQLHGTVSDDPPLVLLEITHEALPQPVRVVGDSQDLVSNGNVFVGMGFRVRLPDDVQGQQPRAELGVDNIGRELMQWIEQSAGGRNAKVRFMQVLRSAPDNIEWEISMYLNNVRATVSEVSGELGFPRLLDVPAVGIRADPQTMPGIF